MLGKSLLKNQAMKGALAGASRLNPKGGKAKKSLISSLMLTSLIDAFCILVIFLLSNGNNSGQQLDLRGKIQLPQVVHSEAMGMGTVVKFVDGKYFVDDKPVTAQGLPAALYAIEKKGDLIVQADRKVEFVEMNPIILAASHAGFEKFKFVVIQAGSQHQQRMANK